MKPEPLDRKASQDWWDLKGKLERLDRRARPEQPGRKVKPEPLDRKVSQDWWDLKGKLERLGLPETKGLLGRKASAAHRGSAVRPGRRGRRESPDLLARSDRRVTPA